MKFFTPELYVRGNSDDDDEVDRVEEEWQQALARYRRHYRKIKPKIPESLRKFHEGYCLHDADVFGPARLSVQTLPWSFQDVVIVAQNRNTLWPEHLNTLLFLQYAVAAEPVIEIPVKSDVFSKGPPHWLYEELDIVEPGIYSHEILFSDGRVVKIVFRELRYHLAKLCEPVRLTDEKPIAADRAASA